MAKDGDDGGDQKKKTDDEGGGDEDDEEMIEEEMLEEYREMLTQLGFFPDKVQINSLSMVAEDHADHAKSAEALYRTIRSMLTDPTVNPGRLLPLVYVVDSVLKNAKGHFVPLIEDDAKSWIPAVHGIMADAGREEERHKFRKVLNTWREFGIFGEGAVRDMVRCFGAADSDAAGRAASKVASEAQATSVLRDISPPVRRQMQAVLDDMQKDVEELDKVSLERLAAIDPALLGKIREAAVEAEAAGAGVLGGGGSAMVGAGGGGGGGGPGGASSSSRTTSTAEPPPIIPDTRPGHEVERSREWAAVDFGDEAARGLVGNLQKLLRGGTAAASAVDEVDSSVGLLAAASATAHHLTEMMTHLQDRAKAAKDGESRPTGGGGMSASGGRSGEALRRHVNPSNFTTEGLKEKDEYSWFVGWLYEIGLPFVCASDGRRFATQIEYSHHLDELFRKTQAEKSMERTEERGWYVARNVWTGQAVVGGAGAPDGQAAGPDADEQLDPASSTVPADENRSKCVICGISFNMFFDQDEGEWMYSNCREVEVLNDDAAEEESGLELAHVTCLRALGSPDRLTMDQVLQL